MDEHVLAERLITYDTASGEGLRAAAGFVKGWLESRELKVDGSDHDGLPVILAEAGPADGPTVVFHGHLDVVPAREGQFTPRVAGDRLIGRGAYDMKGALAAMMCAVRDVATQDKVRVRFVCGTRSVPRRRGSPPSGLLRLGARGRTGQKRAVPASASGASGAKSRGDRI